MADINTGQRTYFLGLSSTGVTTSTNIKVPFKDTAGNVIKCNYFKIDAINNSPTSVALVMAEVSGVSATTLHSNNPTLSAIYSTTALPTSGSLGIGIVLGGGSVGSSEWHADNGEFCNGVTLKLVAQSSTILLGITYGNLLNYNTLRSSSYDVGV